MDLIITAVSGADGAAIRSAHGVGAEAGEVGALEGSRGIYLLY